MRAEFPIKSKKGIEYDLLDALSRNPLIIMAGDDICGVAKSEIERLRAKLAEAEKDFGFLRSYFETAQGNWDLTLARAEAAEKRLAFADEQAKKLEALLDPHVAWDGQPTEIERLRAKLASAKEVIAPFAQVVEWDIGDIDYDDDQYFPMSPHCAAGEVLKVGHLRAAAEWMEKGDE